MMERKERKPATEYQTNEWMNETNERPKPMKREKETNRSISMLNNASNINESPVTM